jgi:hypothetical protein
MILLGDDFRIGVVISLRVSPQSNAATQELITRPIRKSSWKSLRNDIFID